MKKIHIIENTFCVQLENSQKVEKRNTENISQGHGNLWRQERGVKENMQESFYTYFLFKLRFCFSSL